MDPQTNTKTLKDLTPAQKLEILNKVKKYTNQNYEGIVNKDDLSVAEKALEDYIKNSK